VVSGEDPLANSTAAVLKAVRASGRRSAFL